MKLKMFLNSAIWEGNGGHDYLDKYIPPFFNEFPVILTDLLYPDPDPFHEKDPDPGGRNETDPSKAGSATLPNILIF